MKKIFTLLFAVGMVTFASAQSRDFGHGKPDIAYSYNGKQSAIQDINRSYDFKIAAIRQNRWMSRWEKEKQINQLQRQRDAEIMRVQFRFERDNHAYNDHSYTDSRKHNW